MAGSDELERFAAAQAPVWSRVEAELRAGRKRGHWMWFVFPQLKGLGRSPTAAHFGLDDLAAAQAYLAHPVLGPRLRLAAGLAAQIRRPVSEAFPPPDDLKLRSCLTLFAAAAPDDPVFEAALRACFGGVRDPLTLARLG